MGLTNDQFQQLLQEYNAASDRKDKANADRKDEANADRKDKANADQKDKANADRCYEQLQQFLNEKCNAEQISHESTDNETKNR